MKSLCLLTRRAGTTREAFRDYYETQHCRLGMKYFPFAKYLRNHVVAASVDIDFDCVSEFYFDAGRGGADLMATSVGDILRAECGRKQSRHLGRRIFYPAHGRRLIETLPEACQARPCTAFALRAVTRGAVVSVYLTTA